MSETEQHPTRKKTPPSSGSEDDGSHRSDGPEEELTLAARLAVLEEENRRLRSEYARAKRSQYRRTAAGLGVVGLLGLVLGFVFTTGSEVLIAFGMTGLFGAVLTLYLTPSQVVAADVGERVYAATAANTTAIVDQLGLSEHRRYIPGEERVAHLYVPQDEDATIPSLGDGPLVTTQKNRGLLLETTGAFLFEDFEQTLTGELATDPESIAVQLGDGLVEQFELADGVETAVDLESDQITFRVSGSAFGDPTRFDHPLTSFLATGVATALDRPTTLTVHEAEKRADWLVTCRWEDDVTD